MSFEKVIRINCGINDSNVPGRLYIHSDGKEIWERVNPDYYLSSYTPQIKGEINPDFFVALAWNNENTPLIDFIYWEGLKDNWKTNPEISAMLLERGEWKNNLDISCGEGIILLEEEEKFRRRTKYLEEYLRQGPDLDYVNGLLEFKDRRNPALIDRHLIP